MYEEDAEGGEVWEGEESKRTDGAESRGLNDDAKDKENMNREINPENRQEKPQPGELADEGKNLNTEAGLMYDSLLGQIDELLGLYPLTSNENYTAQNINPVFF
jgi:hypothetical protein